jgi:predicted nucleic acid-binding protein
MNVDTAARIFLDSSVLVRYLAGDDPARAFAAASLIDGNDTLVVSTGVLFETIHTMRIEFGSTNPRLGEALIALLAKDNVELADADLGRLVASIERTLKRSARRIPDAILAAAAEQAECAWIATFDEGFASPTVPSRLL